MFSHVMVGTNDIERSKRFYDASRLVTYFSICRTVAPFG